MPTFRLPVVYWRAQSGVYTGTLLENLGFAIDTSPEGVLDQLRAWAHHGLKEDVSSWAPTLKEPQLSQHTVKILPELREGERVFPAKTPLNLRLPVVTAGSSWGARICLLPTLATSFYYFEEAELKILVPQSALSMLKGCSPSLLHPMLEPVEVTLEEVQVKLPPAVRRPPPIPVPPILRTVCTPLLGPGAQAGFQRAWGMENVVHRLSQALQNEKYNMILVGKSGSGKTTLLRSALHRLKQRIRAGTPQNEDAETDTQERQGEQTFWLTSGARLIAGMQYLGQWQQRVEQLILALAEVRGTLVIEQLSEFLEAAGGDEGAGLGSFILPYLQQGELRVITEATPEELVACRERLPALFDVLQCPNLHLNYHRELELEILTKVAQAATGTTTLSLAPAAMPEVLRLFSQFQPYQAFPGASTRFVRDLVKQAQKEGSSELSVAHVLSGFARKTGLSETLLSDTLTLPFTSVVETLTQRVVGQPEAVDAAAATICRLKAGIQDPTRPIGVLLFCGPTGVGKTELAKAMSEVLFGAGDRPAQLIRLDMSEFQGPLAGERLVSRPDGTPSPLIQQVRQNPFCVVLLDEIEKASPEVFDVLMSVFDEGRLTDRLGRLTHFQSALILMTSNLGATHSSAFGFGEAPRPSYQAEAMKFFRPEFVNRMDRIVSFSPLGQTQIEQITRLELTRLVKREGLEHRRIRLDASQELVEHLAKTGFHPRYGARPLQRTVERAVVVPLARYLLAHPACVDQTLALRLGPDGLCVIE